MLAHAPILQVIIPLLAAPFAPILGLLLQPRNVRLAADVTWGFTLLVLGIAFMLALILMNAVANGETIIYAIGGWAAPIGIVYVIDAASGFVLLLVSGVSFFITLSVRQMVNAEIDSRDHPLFWSAWLLTIAGMLGQVATGDAFNIFVFLEIASLSAYALVAMGARRDRRALPAAFNYLILGTLGATFYVLGLGLLYMLTGTLNLSDLATRLPDLAQNRAAFTGLAFITIGLMLKMALFPLHLWLVPAYSYAPAAVSALLAATATKVAVYVLIRLLFGVFGVSFPHIFDLIGLGLVVLGLMAAFLGTLAAIIEPNLKRMLAQSSIAQLGYMAIGIGLATRGGLAASFIHLFNHALMKAVLFLAIGNIAAQIGTVTLKKIHGSGRQIPMTMSAILIGGLSLLGIPLTAGFISKIYLIRSQLELELWIVAALTVASSALALAYIWRIVEAAYLHKRPQDAPILQERATQWIPIWLLVGATIWFGINASDLVHAAYAAATMMLGGAQ